MKLLTRIRLLFVLLIVLLMLAAVLLLYVLPRTAGDGFVSELLRLDVSAMQARLCDDTTLAQVAGLLSAGGGEAGSLLAQLTGSPVAIPGREILAQTLVPDAAFYPFTGAYMFHLRMGKALDLAGFKLDAGINSPDITLTLARRDLLHPCVHAG